MRFTLIGLLFLLTARFASADVVPKTYQTVRLTGSIKVDGVLDDEVWKSIPVADQFIMLDPQEGNPITQITEVRLTYDNTALYVAAMMYDTAPDSILHELGKRDEVESLNTDAFKFAIDPYNNRQDGYVFAVSASGVQADYKDSDLLYDAVWESAVTLTKDGWCAELRIPYSAIRFPKKEIQTWGLQFARIIRRNREYDQWTLTPKTAANRMLYWGTLTGVDHIEAPVRLSLTPYLSLYGEESPAYDAQSNLVYQRSTSYSGGADLKYGIDERFTLDMTLLPDFSQVQSDNKVKNLTAFETVYNENRPFFKEGVELFSKGNLFYSRRIGKTPTGFYSLPLNSGDVIVKNPDKVRLLNGTKVSGRTDKGLGLGLFNAITANTYAEVRDIDGNTRQMLTEPLANYNILVIDQNLPHNSDAFIVNTNVMREGSARDANVTAGQFVYETKNHYLRLGANHAVSNIFETELTADNQTVRKTTTGNQGGIYIDKVKGNWRGGAGFEWADKYYDKNDLGQLNVNDYTAQYFYANYNANNPFWKVFKYGQAGINISRNTRLSNDTRTSFDVNIWEFLLFNNNYSLQTSIGANPIGGKDFYEPRSGGRFYKSPWVFYGSLNASTNYNKPLAFDFGGRFSKAPDIGYYSYGYYIVPMIRLSNKWTVKLTTFWDKYDRDQGWAHTISDPDSIIFGQRNIKTIENTVTTRYLFKNDMALSVTARHYWSRGYYTQFYFLNADGTLTNESSYSGNHNFNTNFFNVDVSYSWQFAPGSSFILTYKNETYSDPSPVPFSEFGRKYSSNLDRVMNSPQTNSVSLKVLYYLDYTSVTKRRNKQ